MQDLNIRKDRKAGRITFTRPQALNALTHDMALAIEAALDAWRDDDEVALVIIDAEGERAFCAGGDVAQVYHNARAGDHEAGRKFFADEYRMNAKIRNYAKPIASFMQGFVMGGGVGVGGLASNRVVGDSTQIAMPETGIGLVPDVGGSWLLARAPGHSGEYFGMTGARMNAGDAIFCGFADHYLPEAEWEACKETLAETGSITAIEGREAPTSWLADEDLSLWGKDLATIEAGAGGDAKKALDRASPLSKAATLEMIRAARKDTRIEQSLAREYAFTSRATEQSDFLEGVRAQIIDKDRKPVWSAPSDAAAVAAILAPVEGGPFPPEEE